MKAPVITLEEHNRAMEKVVDRLKLLSVNEAAGILSVHPDTLRKWEERGLITVAAKTLGGHRRYNYLDLMRIKETMFQNT